MPSIDEALRQYGGSGTQQALLAAGVDQISEHQTITFTKYKRRVLPLDGFVYWVRMDLAGDTSEPPTIDVSGSLHYSITKTIDDQGNYGRSTVTFTSKDDAIQNSNADLLIGEFAGMRFAFATTGHYEQAGLWHYTGVAIIPSMASQVVDDISQLDDAKLVVTNSMPFFMQFAAAKPFYGFACPCPLFPYGQSPYDLKPAFGTVMIDGTTAMAGAPILDQWSTAYVLVKETVTLRMYGLDNDGASSMRDALYQWSEDYNYVGLMNAPVISDDRMPQVELLTLGMAKSIKLEISYVQKDVRNIARQYIKRAVPTYTIRERFANVSAGELNYAR